MSTSKSASLLKTLSSVSSLLLSYGLLILANGLFNTLLGVRTRIEGFSTEVIGVIMASYFLGLLAGGVFAVRAVSAVGHIRAFAAFASVMSASALLHPLWISPIPWMGMRLAAGFCMAGMIMVTESWLNERAVNRNRGQVLAFYMITNYFAAGCGQFLLPLADPGKYQLFSVASIIFSLALVPVLMTRANAPRPVSPKRVSLRELYRISPIGLSTIVCTGLVNSTFHGLGAVFAKGIGLSTTGISTFMASTIFGGLILQWPLGRMSDRINRRSVLVAIVLATSIACLAIAYTSHRVNIWLFVAAVIYGGLSFTIYSLGAAHINDLSDPEMRVQIASGLLIAYGVGAASGPLVASQMMVYFGPQGMYLLSALVTGALGLFALYRSIKRTTKVAKRRTPFLPMPGTQFTSEELYTAARDQCDRDLARMSTLQRSREQRPNRSRS